MTEIKKMLLKGSFRNSDVYCELLETGLLYGNDGDLLAESSFGAYMSHARRELYPDGAKKKDLVIKMYQDSSIQDENERIRHIKEAIRSDTRYVHRGLRRRKYEGL